MPRALNDFLLFYAEVEGATPVGTAAGDKPPHTSKVDEELDLVPQEPEQHGLQARPDEFPQLAMVV
jgi:hypothetical protein